EEFSQAPPGYVRLSLYQYEFTGREQGDDNAWWQRRLEWMSPTFRVSKTPSGRLEIRPEKQ
ncbi:MAG: hypothetical protein P8K78_00885, partial [Pirellulales bacterium]|nr:hypothetical protein [Pirellulales bacterium]